MTHKEVVTAELEARRFLKRIEQYKMAMANNEVNKNYDWSPSKYKSAIKRSSMDLSRALTELRR